MTKRMLIDATHDEETRVAVVDGYRLLEFDYESKFRKPLKGSIFLAKVTRVEPSLQAAFVNFGGNRHGFLPFSEIHPDYFRIPIADREALIAEQEEAMQEMAKREEEREGEPDEAPQAGADDPEAVDSLELSESDYDSGSADDPEGIVEDISDEKPIEEIGGRESVFDAADSDLPDPAAIYGDAGDERSPEGFESEEASFNEGEELREENSAEETPSENTGDNAEAAPGEGRGRGRGRFRGRGRNGRGRGRHRMAHNSRRVESFGGEEYDDDGGSDRFRYSLRRRYKIQEVVKRGQIMLVQVSKEERGNKGAAVTTYLSLPGRYCVLMPNSPRGGGVSRKIASFKDRARMREIVRDLSVPQGMSVIVRTAGVSREKPEIERDLDYLMRLWDNIRELTLQSSAPALVYEEADLIKRAVRDLYGPDIDDVVVEGKEGYETAKNFMKMLVPSHAKKVTEYDEQDMPLFHKYRVEEQIAEIGESHVTLPSGGYMVINQTEALVAVDINSGRATKERHIEETALKTNLEAASEIARQLRLRDLGGLVVVDFIDMEDRRNNAKVERRMRDALSGDRARIQMGRISSFGLMELSRQRLNPSLTESQFEVCQHCKGMGRVRTCDATSIMVLRAIEDEGIKGRAKQVIAHVSNDVALYIMNNKRKNLSGMETRYGMTILIRVDETVGASSFRIETAKHSAPEGQEPRETFKDVRPAMAQPVEGDVIEETESDDMPREENGRREFRDRGDRGGRDGRRGRGRRGGRGRGRDDRPHNNNQGHKRMGPRTEGEFDDRQPDHLAGGFEPAPGNENFQDDFNYEDPDDNRGNREEYNKSTFVERQERSRGGRGRGDGRDGGRGRGRGGRDRGGRNRPGGKPRGGRDFQDFGPRNNDAPRFEESSHDAPQPVSAPRQERHEAPPLPKAEKPQRVETPQEDRSAEQHARTFETVNEPPKQKKRGWWSKGE